MRTIGWMVAVAVLLPWAAVGQQVVDVGSNGSLGPLVVNVSTQLVLPEDGVLHYTTVTISAPVTFRPNARNTPVYLLATGDVDVRPGGSLSVVGAQGTAVAGGVGGPGAFDGGAPPTAEEPAGWGRGPGGGAPGIAGTFDYGTPLMMPLVGGSGGGGVAGAGGGGGGGAILVGSNTRISFRTAPIDIRGATGVAGRGNAGSSGTVRLVAPVISFDHAIFGTSRPRVRLDTLAEPFFAPNDVTLSIGAVMKAFLPNPPSLRVTSVAGQAIGEDPPRPPEILIPFGFPARQEITVEGRNFRGLVPIKVVLKPRNGNPGPAYEETIDMNGQPTGSVTLQGDFDANELTTVEVHTDFPPP